MYNGNGTIAVRSIEEFVSLIAIHRQFKLGRGEPRAYEKGCYPSVWRKGHRFADRTPVRTGSSFTRGELEALKACERDFQDGNLDDRFIRRLENLPAVEDCIDTEDLLVWAALAQHYNDEMQYPTRLLDLTSDPLVALFFAVCSQPDENGFVFAFHGNYNRLFEAARREPPGQCFDITLFWNEQGHKFTLNANTVMVFEPSFPNQRLAVQRGHFGFTRGIDQHLMNLSPLIYEIPYERKESIVQALEGLNVSEEWLFPKTTWQPARPSRLRHRRRSGVHSASSL